MSEQKKKTTKRKKSRQVKSSQVATESNSSVGRHLKLARGVSYPFRSCRDVTDKGITNMIAHGRVTQPVGPLNFTNGLTSATVTKAPRQVPEHIRKQTEEDLKKILEKDDTYRHTVSLSEPQRIFSHDSKQSRPVSSASVEMKFQNRSCSLSSKSNHSPNPLEEFTEVLNLEETMAGLMSPLKTVTEKLFPGRNLVKELSNDLQKLMKQNAPRSATPTPLPLINKKTGSGSVQRKLVDQFPADNSGEIDHTACTTDDSKKEDIRQGNSNQYYISRPAHNYHFIDSNPFQLVTQNTVKEKTEKTSWQVNSLQNYKSSRLQPDHNLKLLAFVLDGLHPDSGGENIHSRNSADQAFDAKMEHHYSGSEGCNKENQNSIHSFNLGTLINGSYNDMEINGTARPPVKFDNPVYLPKKHRAPENLQMLYENARSLQKQYRVTKNDDRNENFREKLDRIFTDDKRTEMSEGAGAVLGKSGRGDSKFEFQPFDCRKTGMDCRKTEMMDDFGAFLKNYENNSDSSELRSVYSDVSGRQNTMGQEIVKALDAEANKSLKFVGGACEPMEANNRIWELDTHSLINDRPAELRNDVSFIGNSGDNISRFLQNDDREPQSQSSSQCSRCSCGSSRHSGSQGDIFIQTAYMPGFQGGTYKEQFNPQDLIYEQRKTETQGDTSDMDILDYIDSRTDTRQGPHPVRLGQTEASQGPDRHPASGDHPRRMDTGVTLEIPSPDEPKFYPRRMF